MVLLLKTYELLYHVLFKYRKLQKGALLCGVVSWQSRCSLSGATTHPLEPPVHDLLDCAAVRFWEVGYLIWT